MCEQLTDVCASPLWPDSGLHIPGQAMHSVSTLGRPLPELDTPCQQAVWMGTASKTARRQGVRRASGCGHGLSEEVAYSYWPGVVTKLLLCGMR